MIKNQVAILVNFKRPEDTCSCIRSLLQSVETNWYGIICENGSGDDSKQQLMSYLSGLFEERKRGRSPSSKTAIYDYFERSSHSKEVPKVTLVVSVKNLGFSRRQQLGVAEHVSTIRAKVFLVSQQRH